MARTVSSMRCLTLMSTSDRYYPKFAQFSFYEVRSGLPRDNWPAGTIFRDGRGHLRHVRRGKKGGLILVKGGGRSDGHKRTLDDGGHSLLISGTGGMC